MDSQSLNRSSVNLQYTNDIPDNEIKHIVILHEKFTKRRTDRYITNIALAIAKIGYKVTLHTSQFNRADCIEDIPFLDKINIKYSAWWLPRSIFGLFRQNMSTLKAAWMAIRLSFMPPEPKPSAIFLDVDVVALYLIKWLTAYKILYVENFYALKNNDTCFEHSQITPTLFEAKWIKFADDIVVETVGFGEIFRKSFPAVNKEPRILYPSIDIGLWQQPGINIHRIIPDLMDNTILFLTVGKYRRASNFKLSLDSFEMLLDIIDDKTITKRFQLVIAGNCKTLEEKCYYNELISIAKERLCASQVTFLKQLPIIHEKTLMMESAIMIHPAKNDVYSDFLLRAMSLGKPIVASNKGIASKVLVHRLSGVIIEPDARLFAVALKKLMMSPHLQIFLGDMAKDAFQKAYSFESLCERVGKLLSKHISDHDTYVKRLNLKKQQIK